MIWNQTFQCLLPQNLKDFGVKTQKSAVSGGESLTRPLNNLLEDCGKEAEDEVRLRREPSAQHVTSFTLILTVLFGWDIPIGHLTIYATCIYHKLIRYEAFNRTLSPGWCKKWHFYPIMTSWKVFYFFLICNKLQLQSYTVIYSSLFDRKSLWKYEFELF